MSQKLRNFTLAAGMALAAVVASVATPALAQPKEQFFPLLVYRTGEIGRAHV